MRVISQILIFVSLMFVVLSQAGCGGGGGGGGAAPQLNTLIVFEPHRDPATGEIVPILAESGMGFDAIEVDSPSVVVDSGRPSGDRYLLYYEATAANGDVTIGVVTSDEEDFATLTVGRTQAVSLGGATTAFDKGVTDPTVIVDKSVTFGTSGRYLIWFEGRSGADGSVSTIITAESADGLTWTNFMECTGLAPTFAPVRVADPVVVLDGTLYKMWYEAIATTSGSADGPAVIGYAESTDGVDWTLVDAAGNIDFFADSVFGLGAVGNFDGAGVGAPAVMIDELLPIGHPQRFRMWYEAADSLADPQSTIGYATSADGANFTNPLLPQLVPSSDSIVPLPFDSGDIEHPAIAIDSSLGKTDVGYYLMYYTGDGENGTSPNRIGLRRGRE